MSVRLYRFYNIPQGAYGEPFALCDEHLSKQPVPSSCILRKVADGAVEACAICEDERAFNEDEVES